MVKSIKNYDYLVSGIKGGVSYFFVYRADASNYLKYLPVVEKMIESFRFKQLGT